MSNNLSESILEKRIKRFKSIKRGYYSLILIISLYILSLLSPVWVNDKPLIVRFANSQYDNGEKFDDLNNNGKFDFDESFIDAANGEYDIGEEFNDLNGDGKYDEIADKDIERFKFYKNNNFLISKADGYWDERTLLYAESLQKNGIKGNKLEIETYKDATNGKYDIGEEFNDINKNGILDLEEPFYDEAKLFFPAFWDLLDFIPGLSYPIYESKYFNQMTNKFEVDFRLLDKICEKNGDGNYVIMPLYPYHPHEDLKDELDEIYEDDNNNGEYDDGEIFIDQNNDGKWNENNPPTKPDGFGGRHLLGTDNTGRDVFARVIDGFKVSITFAVICTVLSYSIGIIIGGTLGYFGGRVDLFGVRIMEIFSALPFLFIVMILSGFMQPNLFILASILVFLSGWIGISYFIRGEFYREKAKDYVSAAVSMGASNKQVMFKHILPNALTPIITFAPFAIIGYIGTLNMLDLLGYGLQPPAASWGEILKQALENLDNWHMLVFPIIAMTITLFMITFIGEAIREAFDPKVYSRLR